MYTCSVKPAKLLYSACKPFYALRPLRNVMRPKLLWIAVFFSVCISHEAFTQDLPPAVSNLQSFAAGSLVIPMDNDHQALNGEPFNLWSYRLVYELLDNGITLDWVIKSGKAKDEIDFSANASRIYPSAAASGLQNFRAGAFIIDAAQIGTVFNCGGTEDLNVLGIIGAFGHDVAVYQLDQAVTVDVRYELNSIPVIASLDDGSSPETATDVLDYIEMPYDLLSYNEFASNGGCYTFVAQPHLNINDVTNNYITIVTNFLANGGNFYAQCAAVEAFEENAFYLTTNGFNYFGQSLMSMGITYINNDMPIMQFHGGVLGYGVGSVSNFALNGAFNNFGYGGVYGINEENEEAYLVAAGDMNGAARGGNVFYVEGHNYTPQQTIVGNGGNGNTFQSNVIESYNFNRMFFNAIFVPASWNTPCAAADQCVCPGESVAIGCDLNTGLGNTWSPATGLSCTNCENPIASPTVTTTYTVTNNSGCAENTVTVFINCPYPEIITVNDTVTCPNVCVPVTIVPEISGTPLSLTINNVLQPAYTATPSLCPSVTTTYIFQVTADNGLTYSDTAIITVYDPGVPAVSADGSFCEGSTLTLEASNITNPVWAAPVTLSCTACAITSTVLSTDFQTTVNGTDDNGCAISATLDVVVLTNPVITANEPEACFGETLYLQANGAPQFEWIEIAEVGDAVQLTATTSQDITLVGTAANGCTDTILVHVNVIPLINIVVSVSVALCVVDGCTTIEASNVNTISWYDDQMNFLSNDLIYEVCPDVNATYIAFTDDPVCYDPDTVVVTLYDAPIVFAGEDLELCVGLAYELEATGALTYEWQGSSGWSAEGNPVWLVTTESQEIVVTGTTAEGCSDTDTLQVSLLPNPVADYTYTTQYGLLVGLPVTFQDLSTNASCWWWDFEQGGSSSEQNPVYVFDEPGWYPVQLTVCNEFGCLDSIYYVLEMNEDFYYYVPNSFSPDGDGVNDVFGVKGWNISEDNFELTIWNRWGEKIYTITDPNEVWMGNYKNGDHYVPDGVYVWQLVVMNKYSLEMYERRGHVTLFR